MKTILTRVEAIKDLIQEAVDKGVTSVENVHKAILELPISVLEQQGLVETGKAARELQELTVGSVYNAIRAVNRGVGEMASGMFEAADNFVETQVALSEHK